MKRAGIATDSVLRFFGERAGDAARAGEGVFGLIHRRWRRTWRRSNSRSKVWCTRSSLQVIMMSTIGLKRAAPPRHARRLTIRSNYHESEHLHSSRTPQAPLVHPGEPFQEAVPNNNPQAHAVPHKHGPWIRLPQLACAIVVLTFECRSVALGTQAILSEHLLAIAQASSRHPFATNLAHQRQMPCVRFPQL